MGKLRLGTKVKTLDSYLFKKGELTGKIVGRGLDDGLLLVEFDNWNKGHYGGWAKSKYLKGFVPDITHFNCFWMIENQIEPIRKRKAKK